MLRKLEPDESAQQMRWLCGDTWPPKDGGTGFDPADGWPAAVWVLNAMYERDDMPSNLTHHELHQEAIAAGLEEPTVINGVNLDEATVTTGVGLGFTEKPAPPWRRLTWTSLGRREGFGFWAVDGRWPQLRFTPQPDWDDPTVMPVSSWPRVGPTRQSSWPLSILPPTEGSLDEESLLALIAVLSRYTAPKALKHCGFYYGAVPFMGEGATMYTGDLRDLPAFVTSQRGTRLTPSNIWPADHSWLVYTDYDLWATRVSGSPPLIGAIFEDSVLEAIRCG